MRYTSAACRTIFTSTTALLAACLPDPDISLPDLGIPHTIAFDGPYLEGKPGYMRSPLSCEQLNNSLFRPLTWRLTNPGQDELRPRLMSCNEATFIFTLPTHECEMTGACNKTGTRLMVLANKLEYNISGSACELTVSASTDENPFKISRRHYEAFLSIPLSECKNLGLK